MSCRNARSGFLVPPGAEGDPRRPDVSELLLTILLLAPRRGASNPLDRDPQTISEVGVSITPNLVLRSKMQLIRKTVILVSRLLLSPIQH